MARPAARRSTITARAVLVPCGTIRRVARPLRPLIVITCWCLASQPKASIFGGPCDDDQLSPTSMISPKRVPRTERSSGSSRAICAVRGHHAPSMSRPSRDARVSRTGLTGRRCAAALIITAPSWPERTLRCSPGVPLPSSQRLLTDSFGTQWNKQVTLCDPRHRPSQSRSTVHRCGTTEESQYPLILFATGNA